MKQMKKDLKAVAKDLKRLTQKTDKMIRRLEEPEKAQAAKKPKAKKAVAKKPTRVSASGTVLAIVKRSRKGVDKATLIKKTGFEDKKIRDITYRLRKQGKIKRDLKGLHVKA